MIYLRKIFTLGFLCYALVACPAISTETLETPRVEIAIVGGGLAGLTTAHHLNKQGIGADLFEAKGELGGRTYTHYFTPDKRQYFELGGTNIDSDHHTMIGLARELGIPLNKINMRKGGLSFTYGGRAVPEAALIPILAETTALFGETSAAIEADPGSLFEDRDRRKICKSLLLVLERIKNPMVRAFWEVYILDEYCIEPALAPLSLVDWLLEKSKGFEALIKSRTSMDGGTTGDDTSPTDSDTPSEDDGAYFYQVDGGMSRFVYAIETASSLTKIHKQHILTNISKLANNHYLLVFQIPGGEIKVIAQKVIMAIPFSTLRRVGIDDSVGLTELQKRAISELPYGTATKVGIPITGSVSMLYDINLDDKYMAWPGQKAVTVMLGGEAGASCTQDGAEKLVRRLYPSWQARYPAIGEIAATVVKNWSEDPFARGAYSATSTKVDPDLLIPSTRIPEIYQFADPCNNYTFLFAGEHTRADETSAFMEGAAKSGIAAADIIIRRAQSSS